MLNIETIINFEFKGDKYRIEQSRPKYSQVTTTFFKNEKQVFCLGSTKSQAEILEYFFMNIFYEVFEKP